MKCLHVVFSVQENCVGFSMGDNGVRGGAHFLNIDCFMYEVYLMGLVLFAFYSIYCSTCFARLCY